jgi:hypothetical protein
MSASIPAWVPILFLALVLLGYRQSLRHAVKPANLVAVALAMFGLSLYGVFGAFGADTLALLAWAAGYSASVALGAQRVASGLIPAGARVRIAGSWVPLVLVLGIFTAKFALGFAAATHSALLQQQGFAIVMSLALGALSGGFGARALAVHRCAASSSAA